MATKNLSRTPLEGGHLREHRVRRRCHRRQHRHESKAFCRALLRGDVFDDAPPEPLAPEHRWRSWDSIRDTKMAPVHRWIEKQVGRHWDDVYSDIRHRFDTGTRASWYIVKSYLLGSVDRYEHELWYGTMGPYVDDQGILRFRPYRRRWRSPALKEVTHVSDTAVDQWLHDRKIGRCGERLFWFVRSSTQVFSMGMTRMDVRDRRRGHLAPMRDPRVPYRQEKPLSDADLAFLEQLTSSQRMLALLSLVQEYAQRKEEERKFHAWLDSIMEKKRDKRHAA